jgi:hypothetical protein
VGVVIGVGSESLPPLVLQGEGGTVVAVVPIARRVKLTVGLRVTL